jgi:hypothetical protein
MRRGGRGPPTIGPTTLDEHITPLTGPPNRPR